MTYRIWIAGNHDDAVRCVKKWCDGLGDCYAILRCDYVYSGGHETGVCISRINYPRFPEDDSGILKRVQALGAKLAEELYQKSYTIETPSGCDTYFREGPWS